MSFQMWKGNGIASRRVASRKELSALENLLRLLQTDLKTAEIEDLVDGVRSAELAFDESQQWSGRLIAELKTRLSWSQLADLTGLPASTLVRRAKPYM